MVTVASFVVYAETVAAAPIVVARLEKYTVVVAAPAAPGNHAEQNDVKSKFALTVTLRKLDSRPSESQRFCLRCSTRVPSSININYTY
jgi:hypothetical protein